jgi:DNA-binding transcriptional MocR family regulator
MTGFSSELQDNFRYVRLADDIENKIMGGIYKTGEKLPSIRKLHDKAGVSVTTVYQAYIELEKRGVVEPRLKSGFFVKPMLSGVLPSPRLKPHAPLPQKVTLNALVNSILEAMRNPKMLHLGGAAPDADLLPHQQISRLIRSKTNSDMKDLITQYENPSGSLSLRREIAKRMVGIPDSAAVEEIIITNGCMEAINVCLRAVAKPGDTIIVESPAFHCFLQLIEDLNMLAMELPTDPVLGLDLDALEASLEKNEVKACVFNPNFQNPLGFVMSSERKKQLVELLSHRNIPIIEDNIYGELHFDKQPPATLKSFDKKGLVLHCSSFSKTLCPGLRVGWAMPGAFKDAVRRIKLNTSITSPTLNQAVVSDFLKTGAYDRHLRRLRNALKNQMSNMTLAVARYFPKDTRITAPQGGLMLWVELNEAVNGLDVYHAARQNHIAIIPGIVCSTSEKYKNFIRLSCGNPWTDRVEKGVATLGEIVSRLVSS